jgi:chemotaxis signal transduction protein
VARILKLAGSQIGPAPDDGGSPHLAGIAQGEEGVIRILDSKQMLLAGPGMRPSTDKE